MGNFGCSFGPKKWDSEEFIDLVGNKSTSATPSNRFLLAGMFIANMMIAFLQMEKGIEYARDFIHVIANAHLDMKPFSDRVFIDILGTFLKDRVQLFIVLSS